MPTTKQPKHQEAPHQAGDGLDGVRAAYSKLVDHVRRQQDKIGQLEIRIDGQQETIGKLEERLDDLNNLLEIVQQRQYEMEMREQAREQQEKQATLAPEPSAVAQQPEQTHHTLSLSEAQIKRAYAIAHSSGIQPADMKKWVIQKYDKELKDLDRKEYNQLCIILEQAKGKGVLPNLHQPEQEYNKAS